MLRIRNEQIEELGNAKARAFENDLAAQLSQAFPERAAALGADRTASHVRRD